MEVLKTINNNIVVSLDQKNREMIVMGRGLGFKKKAGDTIEEDKIEKIFTLNDKKSNTNFRKLVDDVPMERILVASEIIEYAKKSLQKEAAIKHRTKPPTRVYPHFYQKYNTLKQKHSS